jgi:hypothetical protein
MRPNKGHATFLASLLRFIASKLLGYRGEIALLRRDTPTGKNKKTSGGELN